MHVRLINHRTECKHGWWSSSVLILWMTGNLSRVYPASCMDCINLDQETSIHISQATIQQNGKVVTWFWPFYVDASPNMIHLLLVLWFPTIQTLLIMRNIFMYNFTGFSDALLNSVSYPFECLQQITVHICKDRLPNVLFWKPMTHVSFVCPHKTRKKTYLEIKCKGLELGCVSPLFGGTWNIWQIAVFKSDSF